MLFGEPLGQAKLDDEAMFMNGPHAKEFLDSAMKERMRLASNEGSHPKTGGGRGPRRDTPPIRTVEKEWGGLGGPMPGMRPTMGGPGIQQQQPKGGGTMGIIMPIYTIAIIIFFVYTTMKVLFKNKNDNDDEDETKEKRIGDNVKYDEEYLSNYIKQLTKKNNSEFFNQACNEDSEGVTKKMKTVIEEDDQNDEESETPEEHDGKLPKDMEMSKYPSDEKVGCSVQNINPKSEAKDEVTNTKENIKLNTTDPRDLEIILLKARLEQTEKAMERIFAQMGANAQKPASEVKLLNVTKADKIHEEGVSLTHGCEESITDIGERRDSLGVDNYSSEHCEDS